MQNALGADWFRVSWCLVGVELFRCRPLGGWLGSIGRRIWNRLQAVGWSLRELASSGLGGEEQACHDASTATAGSSHQSRLDFAAPESAIALLSPNAPSVRFNRRRMVNPEQRGMNLRGVGRGFPRDSTVGSEAPQDRSWGHFAGRLLQ